MGYIVYSIKNIINNKYYIGKTTKDLNLRFQQHIKNAKNQINRYLYDAMNRYGYENFICEILDDAENINDLNDKESWYIFLFNSHISKNGYNMTWGGDGGVTIFGRSMKGKTFFDSWVKKYGKKIAEEMKHDHYKKVGPLISKSSVGKKITIETRKKISETNIKKGIKPPTQYWIDRIHPMEGKHHTAESLEKISAARKGKRYEDFYQNKNDIIVRKKDLQERWTKENNPLSILNPNSKYYQPNLLQLAEEIKSLLDQKKLLKDIADALNITLNNCRRYFLEIYHIEIKDYRKRNNL